MADSPAPSRPEPSFDKAAVRRDFARAADGYDRHADLQRRTAARVAGLLAERHRGGTVLDAGAGTGLVGRSLAAATTLPPRWVSLDLAHAMTRAGRLRDQPGITGDVEQLPLATGSVDAVVSSLTLQWALDLDTALAELARVLRPGGVLVAATLARGTLPELETALQRVDGTGDVGPFLPRERMAAALSGAGLRGTACWCEEVVLEADSPRAVLRDLKGLGAVYKAPGRSRGLRGRDRLARLDAAYRAACDCPAGPVPVTWQVAYLVGRCPG